MIVLGVILLLVGLLAGIGFLWALGVVLVIVGAVLWALGSMDRGIAGRRHYF
ncbi:MAG TPA: hypothetical protein VGM91_00195 [Conexibacter sp.]|jgi:hypothetical protein